jgi:hypothetical protein
LFSISSLTASAKLESICAGTADSGGTIAFELFEALELLGTLALLEVLELLEVFEILVTLVTFEVFVAFVLLLTTKVISFKITLLI